MKHYSVVSESDKHFELHDARDGKTFNVAKKGLDKSHLTKIKGLKKFAFGGVGQGDAPGVNPDDAPITNSPDTSPTELSPQEAGLQAYKQSLATQPTVTRYGVTAPAILNPEQKERKAEDTGVAAKNYVENQQQSQNISDANNAQDLAMRNKNRESLGLPPLPGAPGVTDNIQSGIAPASFQPPQQVNPGNGIAAANNMTDYNKAFTAEQGANTAIGKAQSARAQQEAETQADFQTQMQGIHNDYAKQFSDNQAKQDEIMADIQKNPINADHYWSNKSVGGKISTIIGLLLGGAGSGGQQSNNAASNALDQSINRDIQAQKDNMGQKNNLLNYYMKQYGNLQQAQMAAKSDLLTVTQAKLNQAAAQSNDPIAKQTAVQQNAQIAIQKAQLNHQLAMQSAIYGASDPLTAKIALGLTGDEQKRALDEKGSFETHQKALSNIKGLYNQSNADESFGNYALHPLETSRKADVLNAGIDDALLSTDTAKRMSPEVQKTMLEPYHIKVTDNKDVRAAKFVGALQKVNTFAPATPLLSGLGWLPNNKGPVNFKPR
jgi:hypothetical protein